MQLLIYYQNKHFFFNSTYIHVCISKRSENQKWHFIHFYIYCRNEVFVSILPFLFLLRAHILPRICMYPGQLLYLSSVTHRHPFPFFSFLCIFFLNLNSFIFPSTLSSLLQLMLSYCPACNQFELRILVVTFNFFSQHRLGRMPTCKF